MMDKKQKDDEERLFQIRSEIEKLQQESKSIFLSLRKKRDEERRAKMKIKISVYDIECVLDDFRKKHIYLKERYDRIELD